MQRPTKPTAYGHLTQPAVLVCRRVSRLRRSPQCGKRPYLDNLDLNMHFPLNIKNQKRFQFCENRLFLLQLCLLLILSSCCVEASESTNAPAPTWWENERSTIWTAQSNSLRSGLAWSPDSSVQKMSLLLFSGNSNGPSDYVYTPGHKLSRAELRDPDGLVVPPRTPGSRLDAELAQKIAAEDLPKLEGGGPFRGRGVDHEYVLLQPGGPSRVLDFAIADVYNVKKEGDYSLTLCPALYRFTTNRKFLICVDWPCVSVKIHLQPHPAGESRYSGAFVYTAAALALCGIAAFWLLARFSTGKRVRVKGSPLAGSVLEK